MPGRSKTVRHNLRTPDIQWPYSMRASIRPTRRANGAAAPKQTAGQCEQHGIDLPGTTTSGSASYFRHARALSQCALHSRRSSALPMPRSVRTPPVGTPARSAADHLLIHARLLNGCALNVEIAGSHSPDSELQFRIVGTEGELVMGGNHWAGPHASDLTLSGFVPFEWPLRKAALSTSIKTSPRDVKKKPRKASPCGVFCFLVVTGDFNARQCPQNGDIPTAPSREFSSLDCLTGPNRNASNRSPIAGALVGT